MLVDRTTKWGSPFRIGDDGTRDEVCDQHADWFDLQFDLIDDLGELRGLDLVCHCAPERCHAEYLLMLANDDTPITSFAGRYRFLSNFFPSEITCLGRAWATVEHAYQASKSFRPEDHARVAACSTPAEAKRVGRHVALRPDWEERKVGIMATLVERKFLDHPDLRAKLLDTGDRELVEGNNWGDSFWGVFAGQGRNELGKILMEVRTELRSHKASPVAREKVKTIEIDMFPDEEEAPGLPADLIADQLRDEGHDPATALDEAEKHVAERDGESRDPLPAPDLRCLGCGASGSVRRRPYEEKLRPGEYRYGCMNCGNIPEDGVESVDMIDRLLKARPRETRRAALELLYLRVLEIEKTWVSASIPLRRALMRETLDLPSQDQVAKSFETLGLFNGLVIRLPALKGDRFASVFRDCLMLLPQIAGPAAADWSDTALRKEFASRVRDAIAKKPSILLEEKGCSCDGVIGDDPECEMHSFARIEARKAEREANELRVTVSLAPAAPLLEEVLGPADELAKQVVEELKKEQRLAHFSDDRKYRYVLKLVWNRELPIFVVIGLNPSTADEKVDDATIRRCRNFAKREGCGTLIMLNAYAWRDTDPNELDAKRAMGVNVIGEDNDEHIRTECAIANEFVGSKFVLAWGQNVEESRAADVVKLLRTIGCEIHCLGRTKHGHPRHPLRLSSETPLELFA